MKLEVHEHYVAFRGYVGMIQRPPVMENQMDNEMESGILWTGTER